MSHGESALDQLLAGWIEADSVPKVEISGLVHDSRRVRPGDLFVALAGQHAHGLAHAEQAIKQGCAAIVFDPEGGGDPLAPMTSVPCVRVEGLAHKLGHIADRFFGAPSRQLATVIGITGTNGKTSCSQFLAQALTARWPAAVVGTLGWGKPGELAPTTHTTPDAIEVHALLSQLYRQGYRAVAMEASSHGLVQGRLNGVRFQGALYTNFTRDHLDYHGTMEAYLDAKLRLLDWPELEFVVFNANNTLMAEAILARKPATVRALGFRVDGGEQSHNDPNILMTHSVRHSGEGLAFRACYQGHEVALHAPVFGDFNVENLTASLGVLLALGYDLDAAAEALGKVRAVPGRMESFTAAGRTVVVDYAHTPDALANVLTSLRRHCQGRLWVVFGCGGDRDRGKRPEMGAIAERLADQVVLTDDNPRSEDGEAIIRDILEGCRRADIVSIRDRRAAIGFALERAEPADLVLVAGKGHETTQEIQGQKYPFSDRQVVAEFLEQLGVMA